ncbi:MAG: glycosyltransferase family 2 protein, partial [Ruminiclostridium sp.]|nr:glycosyltransferase family 2 protein [Ruminiclostridium sp.]
MLTILIPLYNSAKDISTLISTLYPLETDCELLLINEGSTDNTPIICKTLAQSHSEIKFIDLPHGGVSAARNVGLKAAKGDFILFLDSDDRLSKGSIKALADFCDTLPDDVDLVTYPIETIYRGNLQPPHFRYRYLLSSGVYDLNLYPYIGQTTMNIVVRNRFEDNIMFDENMTFNEDQKYCCQIAKNSLKMGFCAEAKYIYNRSENSSSGKISGACYIFEQAMKMFEDIFRGYNYVPAAFQGLYINDLAWKLRSNILYPYHYDEKSFEFAMERIKALLAKVDIDVILNHPDINYFHKFYWLSLKPNADVKPFFEKNRFGLVSDCVRIYSKTKFEIVVVRIRTDNGNFIFRGFIKSPVFSFFEKPELYAVINGESVKQELFVSAHSYYFCHTKTNTFYGFCLEKPENELNTLSFKVKIGGIDYNCIYTFMPKSPFSHSLKRYDSVVGKRHLRYNTKKGEFSFGNVNISDVLNENTNDVLANCVSLRKKAVKLKEKERIHLYMDCRGVEKDNGYFKFLEDWGKRDG